MAAHYHETSKNQYLFVHSDRLEDDYNLVSEEFLVQLIEVLYLFLALPNEEAITFLPFYYPLNKSFHLIVPYVLVFG